MHRAGIGERKTAINSKETYEDDRESIGNRTHLPGSHWRLASPEVQVHAAAKSLCAEGLCAKSLSTRAVGSRKIRARKVGASTVVAACDPVSLQDLRTVALHRFLAVSVAGGLAARC